MKNFIYTLVAIATTSIVLFSCNSEPKPIVLTPKYTSLRGDLKEYFEVVDKEYTLSEALFGMMITVELKKTKEMPFDKSTTEAYGTSGYDVERHMGFGIKIFDEQNNIVEQRSATKGGMQGPDSSEDVVNFKNIEVGETGIIRWTLDTEDAEILKTLNSFEITSATEDVSNTSDNWGSQKSKSNPSSASKASSGGSAKWDAILDEYDEYVEKYIKMMKKANSGDMNAISDSASLMASAESLSEKLEDAEGELSLTQMARYTKISTKMLEVGF